MIRPPVRQQEHLTGHFRVELCLWVEPAEQAGLEKLGVAACEGGPTAAVAALPEMLLDERHVRHGDRFMVPIRLSQVFGVIADRAPNPLQ